MTDADTAALVHAEFQKIRESFKPHRFWDWLMKLSAVAVVAISSFIWGHESRLDDHSTRLALIEQSSTGVHPKLEKIQSELQTISERLARLEARGGGD